MMKDAFTHLYVICHTTDDGCYRAPCKIGMAGDPERRLRGLQTANAHKLCLYSTIRMPREIASSVERGLVQTNEGRMVGEWTSEEPPKVLAAMKLWLAWTGELFAKLDSDVVWATIDRDSWCVVGGQ